MSTKKINPRLAVLMLMILSAAAMRIPNAMQATPWAAYTPIGAMALFSGAHFSSRWKAILLPLLTLLVSDLVIQLLVYDGRYGILYGGWYIIYSIFVLLVFIGKWIIPTISVKNIVLASVVAAVSHWLIADFTVWIGGGTDLRTITPLTRNLAGLVQCYAQGFPFMKSFLVGNLVYGGMLFGGFELARKQFPVLTLQPA